MQPDFRTYRLNLLGRQFAASISVTCGLSSFFNHVLHVVGKSAGKQMVRIDAFPIVAMVKDLLLRFTVGQFISHSVCVSGFSVFMELPVAIWH